MIGGGGYIGQCVGEPDGAQTAVSCQDRYRAWGFGQRDRWFDLEVVATAGGGWWAIDR